MRSFRIIWEGPNARTSPFKRHRRDWTDRRGDDTGEEAVAA